MIEINCKSCNKKHRTFEDAAYCDVKRLNEQIDQLVATLATALNAAQDLRDIGDDWKARAEAAEAAVERLEAEKYDLELLSEDRLVAGFKAEARAEAAEAKAERYVLTLNGRYWVLIDGEYSCAFCGSLRTDGHTSGCIKAELDNEKGT